MKHVHKTNASKRRFYQWHWAKLLSIGLLCVVGVSPAAYAQEDDDCGPGDEEWREECMPGRWRVVGIQGQGNITGDPTPTSTTWLHPGVEDFYDSGRFYTSATATNGLTNSYPQHYVALVGSGSIGISGKFKVKLKWIGQGTPTDSASVLISTSASAAAYAHYTTQPQWEVKADTGLGDPIEDSGESNNNNIPADGIYQKGKNINSYGIRIIEQIDTSGGATEVEKELSLSPTANAKITIRYRHQGVDRQQPLPQATVILGASAKADNRSVRLTRMNAIGEKSGIQDGVPITYGDTIYSYKRVPGSILGNVIFNDQNIISGRSGDWSSSFNYDWSISGGASFIGPNDNSQSVARMNTGQLEQYPRLDGTTYWKGQAGGSTQAIITYTGHDVDGASASAKYILKIHEPVEKDHEDSYEVYTYIPKWDTGNPGGDPSGVAKIYGYAGAGAMEVSYGSGTSQGFSATVSGDLTVGEVGPSLGISDEWSTEKSHDLSVTYGSPEVPIGKMTYPVRFDTYTRHNYYFRHFNPNGEHALPSIEAPPGSGLYDTPIHHVTQDEWTGGGITWPIKDIGTTGPAYTTTPEPPTKTPPSYYDL